MNSPHYKAAQQQYADRGIDTETAIHILAHTPIALHCWQGDDVTGFETSSPQLQNAGIQPTGNYPGKARTPKELRQDLKQAFDLIPGFHRLNLHACYAECAGRFVDVDRDELTMEHFQSWVDWCQEHRLGLDFNPTFFSHPLASEGLTLTHPDTTTRAFWIRHGIACRQLSEQIGQQLGSPTVYNIWIPDGSKDNLIDRKSPRLRLEESLDQIFKNPLDPQWILESVESKLFGIGSESYVAGSHEFYLGYAITRKKLLCLDAGHFHPTESLADKISSVMQFVPGVLLHVSRGIRWDSDHVVILDDPTRAIFEEVIRGDFLSRTHIGLDFFDASINRVAAWVLGARATQKSILLALLEPIESLRQLEREKDFTSRLALLEETKSLPFGAIWEEFCLRQNTPGSTAWLKEIKHYEQSVLSHRSST